MIVIVEDDPQFAVLVTITLESYSALPDGTAIKIAVHATGDAARQWLTQQPMGSVAVVVLDRHLGTTEDGLNLIPELRNSGVLRRDAVIVVWSAASDPEDARRAGADAFLNKSASPPVVQRLMHVIAYLWAADAAGQPRLWIALT